MKSSLFILLFLITGVLVSQNSPIVPAKFFPTVEGEVFEAKNRLSEVNVNVYNKDRLIFSTKTDSLGKYSLKFNIDSVYTIELFKEKYITKRYEVSTKDLTAERLKNPVNQINAQTEMHKMVPEVDYTHYKKPMVKFFFNKKTDKFVYDEKHYANAYAAQKKITAKEKTASGKKKK